MIKLQPSCFLIMGYVGITLQRCKSLLYVRAHIFFHHFRFPLTMVSAIVFVCALLTVSSAYRLPMDGRFFLWNYHFWSLERCLLFYHLFMNMTLRWKTVETAINSKPSLNQEDVRLLLNIKISFLHGWIINVSDLQCHQTIIISTNHSPLR